MVSYLKNNVDILYVLLSMLLLMARDVLTVPVPDFVLVGIWVVAMLSMNYEHLVTFVFFLFPLSCGVPGYSYLLIYVFLLIKGPKLNASQIIPIALVTLLELFNELIGADTNILIRGISFLSFTGLFFYFIGLDELQFDIKKAILYYVVGSSFCCMIIYYNMFKFYGIDGVLSGFFRSGALGVADNDLNEMAGHIAMNANTIAYFAISAISSILICIRYYNNKSLLIFALLILLVSGLLSFSRTFIFSVVLLVVTFFLTNNIKNFSYYIIIASIIGMAVIFVFHDFFSSLLNTFIARGQEESINTAGGRTFLFSFYNNAWISDLEHVIYGAGAISHVKVLNGYNAVHNGLQQLWVSLGIIGFMVFFVRILGYLKEHFVSSSKVFFIPFLVTFAFDQSIQFLNPYPLELPIMVTLLVLQFDKQCDI